MTYRYLFCVFLAFFSFTLPAASIFGKEGLALYYWQQPHFVNFGDFLSLKLVEHVVGKPVTVSPQKNAQKKLLAIGSILSFAGQGDVIWGAGINGKCMKKQDYNFTALDIRAVRGPLTRQFLKEKFNINAPEVYGDPALLMPYLFPEFKKATNPEYDYIVIPHYSEEKLFIKEKKKYTVVYPTEPWDEVIKKILNSKLVISSSLHGLIVAEAYGIPARMLRVTGNEPFFKYEDYYFGTGRHSFQYASSVAEAVSLGGEAPVVIDLEKLYDAFPFEFWGVKKKPIFSCK